MAGIAAQNHNAIGQQHGFFNIVGDDEDGLGGHGFLSPQLQQFTAQVLGGQHVEGAEWLIHKQDFGLNHQRAGKADALLHAAGELLGICAFKTIEANSIQHAHAALAIFIRVNAAGLQRRLHIFKHGKPGEEREALKDDGDVDLRLGDWLLVPVNLPSGGRGKAA